MSTVTPKLTQTLSQKQSLILTQELQLFLKLIQMNTIELKEYLDEQLIENPTLEENDEAPPESELPENDFKEKEENEIDLNKEYAENLSYRDEVLSGYREVLSEGEDDRPSWENRVSATESLVEHLQWQVEMLDLTKEEKHVSSIIVGNINEDGYLESDLEEIARQYVLELTKNRDGYVNGNDNVAEAQHLNGHAIETESNPDIDESISLLVEDILSMLQEDLDPPGVCARTLNECLTIQANELDLVKDHPIFNIIANYLEELSEKNYSFIAEALEIPISEVKEATSIISTLEPRPGRPFFSQEATKHIVPDFFVYKVGEEYQIQLSQEIPRIRISRFYRGLLGRAGNLAPLEKKYLREKLESAKRIIKCLDEREQTVRKILGEIVRVQTDFFEYGFDYIRPLRLKDVAAKANVHESTVSRITSKRYIVTPQGTIGLKSLFSRRIQTSVGQQDISFEKVKSIIKDIVEEEPDNHPYSDEDLSKILKRRNIKVARRTVAKYRKIMEIPSSSQRAKINSANV